MSNLPLEEDLCSMIHPTWRYSYVIEGSILFRAVKGQSAVLNPLMRLRLQDSQPQAFYSPVTRYEALPICALNLIMSCGGEI